MAGSTLIEPELWQDIRRKLYLPQDVDEYSSTSRSLTGIFHNSIHYMINFSLK